MESGQSAIDYAVEVIKAVRQQSTNKGVPIIVITNLDQSQILTEVQKLDIQGYYIKSNTSLEKLVEIINKIFSPEN
jgi:DNA-binding NarL/FixJ family response regulator